MIPGGAVQLALSKGGGSPGSKITVGKWERCKNHLIY